MYYLLEELAFQREREIAARTRAPLFPAHMGGPGDRAASGRVRRSSPAAARRQLWPGWLPGVTHARIRDASL